MKIIGTKVEIEGIIAAVNCTNASCECCLIGDYCKTHGTGEFTRSTLEDVIGVEVEEVE